MNLLELIKAEEGFRPLVYDDATGQRLVPGYTLKGNATIGYGWACGINPMSEAEAEAMLRARLGHAEAETAGLLGVPAWERLDPVRRAALTSMAYQMGRQGLRGFAMLLGAVRSGDWVRAHAEALDSRWAAQTPARAARMADMLLTGQWPVDERPAA